MIDCNNEQELIFYFIDKTRVEVETTEGSYTTGVKDMELKRGESKHFIFPKAKVFQEDYL